MEKLVIILGLLLLPLVAAAAIPASGKQVVKEAEVRRAIVDYLEKRTAGLGVELNVRKIGYRGDLELPTGSTAFEVVAPAQWEGWGNANLALVVRVNDRVERNIPVRVEVEALAEVVVTVRHLERGEVLGPADLVLQKRDLASVGGRVCRTPEEAFGKRMRVGMRGNVPLRVDYLEKVPLVKSGQQVTLLLETASLQVTATGRARSGGAEGDLIMVQNMASQKDVRGRIVDATTVRVDLR
jgi:flagella basal body P-ring formation protein FlgA